MNNEKMLLDKIVRNCEIDSDYLDYAEEMAESMVDEGVRVLPLLLNEYVMIRTDKNEHGYYVTKIKYEVDDFNEIWVFTAISENTGETYTFTDADIGVTVFV